jgi:hypothetical protein
MLHWREKYFENLRHVASLARTTPEWSEYAVFCEKYEQGLRREAFAHLGHFIAYLEEAPFAERRKFVRWLLPRVDGIEGRHMLVPHPLSHRVVERTLCEWILAESESAEPHFWLGGYENLKRALELKPDDDTIRRKLIVWILNRVDWATHELPTGYIGEPADDLTALDEASGLIAQLSNELEGAEFADEVRGQRAMIQSYLSTRRERADPTTPD